jgi:hypothetical protein
MVAMTKYGPRRRLDRKPITVPAAVARAAPIARPYQGEMFQRTPQSAAAYAPRPKNAEWPSEICPA